MSAQPVTLEEWREQMLPHFTATEADLLRHLNGEIERVAEALRLDRKFFLLSSRVKAADSAARTAARRRIDYWKLPDWVALRISCPTPESAYHLSLALNSLSLWQARERFDYNINPKLNGYRGVHVYGVVARSNRDVRCELQLHTRLQSLWSDLTHDEVYKPGSPTSSLVRDTSTNLAAYMAATDQFIGRMLKIIRDPDAQMRPFETAEKHLWIATMALLHPSMPDELVETAIAITRQRGIHSDEQLGWLLQRWQGNKFEKLHDAVVSAWAEAGCAEATVLDTLAVAARLVSERVRAEDHKRVLGTWARDRAAEMVEQVAVSEEEDVQ